MAVTFTWDNPDKTIGLFTFEGVWRWAEFWDVYYEVERMLDELGHETQFIVYIADDVPRNYIPPNILSNILKAYRNPHPNAGHTVVVAQGYIIARPVYMMLSRLYPRISRRFSFANTLDEARQILARRTQ